MHPDYSIKDVTQFRYTNRIVGELPQQWPAAPSHLPANPHKQPFQVEPVVTNVEPSVERPAYSVRDEPVRFHLAPWVLSDPQLPTEPMPTDPLGIPQQPTTTAAPYASSVEDAGTQFLPSPWVVAPPAVPQAPMSSRPTVTTTSEYATQPQVEASEVTSPEKSQTLRRRKSQAEWWTPNSWP